MIVMVGNSRGFAGAQIGTVVPEVGNLGRSTGRDAEV